MLNPAEHYVQKEIAKLGGLPEIDQAVELVCKYVNKCYSYTKKNGEVKHLASKNRRLEQWGPDKGEIYELVLAAFTTMLSNRTLTIQAAAGILAGRIRLLDDIERVTTAAEVLTVISFTGLVTITRSGSGNYIMVSTEYELDNIPCPDRHEILMEKPPIYKKNWHEDFGSRILGGRQNHHDGDICLDHINRMNSIPFQLNKPFLRKYEEAPTFAFVDKYGNHSQQKEDQWNTFVRTSYRKYIEVSHKGNRFFLNHNDDKRGRCYAEGYHISTQGSSFKKAIVQLADVELVEG